VVAAFYISGHGFGHATRDIEVIRALARQQPALHVVVKTSAPAWLFDGLENVTLMPTETDTGAAQLDSLRLEEERTATDAARFHATFDDRVGREAAALRDRRAAVVVGDIPALAFAAATRVGIPSVALANFTWDWIYEGMPRFESLAPGVLQMIRDAYAQADVALRLPMHGGFAPMASVTRDISLVARRSSRPRDETRHLLELTDRVPVVLASFGGHGLDLDYRQIAATNGFTLVVTDDEAGTVIERAVLRRFSRRALRALGVGYEDLVAAADVVVTKPGYGIVSECAANRTAMVYASRGSFVEQDILVKAMPGLLRCRVIEQQDLLAGRWQDAVDGVLAQPEPGEHVRADGADQAAAAILDFV